MLCWVGLGWVGFG